MLALTHRAGSSTTAMAAMVAFVAHGNRPWRQLATKAFAESPTDSTSSSSSEVSKSDRHSALHESLQAIGVDPLVLRDANLQFTENPMAGYDDRFGKSAMRAYRSFLRARSISESDKTIELQVAAARCARQIDFLIKRHKSHQTDWVRHHDKSENDNANDNDHKGDPKPIRTTFPLFLILDNLRSAYNVGSLFRTAEACGCRMVLTAGITPHPGGNGSDKVRKSALGAERLVESRHFDTTAQAVKYLRQEFPHVQLLAMETTDRSQRYTDVVFRKLGVALVLGNEVTGVDTELLTKIVDGIIEIPMFGAKNSLNVASCAPVVLYEILRQWKV